MNDETDSSQPERPPGRPHRPRTLKGGAILGRPEDSEIACTIRNMHEAGAELAVPDDRPIPDEFLLYVRADGIAYRCRLRWRDGKRAGVSFHGTEPKPHWHYG